MRAFIIIGVLALAQAAYAQENARAKIDYKEGSKLYNLGEYSSALDKFKAAYLAVPDPVFLFNIAQCQRQLQQWEAASKSYRAFLREAPNIPPKVRDDVGRLVTEMDAAVRDERMKKPPTETRPPEMNQQQQTPQQTPPPEEKKPPVVEAPPPPPTPWYKNGAGMALTFGGAGIIIVGGGLLGKSAADVNASNTANTLPDARTLHDSAVTFQSAGLALIGVGAAAAVTGSILLILSARKPAARTHASR